VTNSGIIEGTPPASPSSGFLALFLHDDLKLPTLSEFLDEHIFSKKS